MECESEVELVSSVENVKDESEGDVVCEKA